MNAKKFCFIICVKREDYLKECIFYLEQLKVPEGYSMQIQPIRRATSMAGAYNMAMQASDAKYKIYLHQDCFVINPNFLYDLLMIFENDRKIGMVGMVGSPQTPPDLLPWHGVRIGNGYSWDVENTDYKDYSYKLTDGIKDVESIDGMLMATAFDLPWREAQSDGPKGVEIPPPCADGRGPHPRRPRPRCFILPYQVCGCRIHMPRLQTMLTV